MDDSRRGRRARRLISTLVAVATIGFPSLTFAQRFDDVGVRAQGMAGAFVAVADDASATWWNPAGLATSLGIAEASGEAGQDGLRGIALTFPSLGVSYYRLRISEIQPSSTTGTDPSNRQDVGVISQFGATFGQSISPHIVLATTIKLVNAQSDTQADLDVGVMASVGVLRLGVTVRDLRNPTFGSGANAFELGRRARAGAAVIVPARGALDRVVFAVDADLSAMRTLARDEQDVTGGVETWWFDRRFGLRAGGGTDTAAGGCAFGAFGVSVMPYPRVNIDGAVTRAADSGRNRWTLGLRLAF